VANGHALAGSDYSGVFTLFGSANGTSTVDGTNDFFLVLFDPAIAGPVFSYTSPGVIGSVPSVPVVTRVSSVPDSGSSMVLFAIVILGVVLLSRRPAVMD